jgi:periplasmic protein CpxP/Spy
MPFYSESAPRPQTARRLALLGILASPAIALAQPGGPKADRPAMMQRRLSHLLDALEASAEQRTRIVAIASAVTRDLSGVREQLRALRARGMALLGAPTIDRAAAETVRAQTAALRDQQSKRMHNAMLDAAEVLSPAQRAKAAALIAERAGRGRGDRHERGGFMRQSGELDIGSMWQLV